MKKYQICESCIMDTSEPSITFDDKGVCIYCNDYKIIQSNPKNNLSEKEKEEKLNQHLAQIKKDGEGKEYDCIIGLSGGVDSSYVACLIHKYGLRALAVHLDNGWDAELAVMNIENICNKLNIDLYTHVIDWEEFKDLQLSFLKSSVRNAEAPTDHAIFAVLHNLAKKYRIKWIIDGVNHATEFVRNTRGEESGGGYAYSDLKQILGIHKIFSKEKLKTYPKMSYLRKLILRHILGVKQFSILNFVPYNKDEAKELLISDLGWRSYGAKHHESLFTKWHQVVYLVKKFGYDKRRLHLSDLILSGQLKREDALKEISMPPLPKNEIVDLEEYVMKKLGLSSHQYSEILNAKHKSFRDYPNHEWISRLYKKYTLK